MIRILAFSDPHGRIPLLLRLVWQYQHETARAPDLVVVAGDLGIWPREDRLDQATRKHARADPAELGFLAFDHFEEPHAGELSILATPQRDRERRLLSSMLPEIACPVLFVGGNHEDYEYLLRCQARAGGAPVPVERRGVLGWLPPGRIFEIRGARLAGLSGIGAEEAGRDPDRYHPAGVLDDDSVIAALAGLDGRRVDILMTHDGLPEAVRPGRGTELIEEAIESVAPRFHVFGHYHSRAGILDYGELRPRLAHVPTRGVHLNKLGFDRAGSLRPHSVGLFEGDDAENLEFRFLDEAWLKKITPRSWLHGPRGGS